MTFKEYKADNKHFNKSLNFTLDLTGKGLTDIDGIEEYTNITILFLGFNDLTDIEPLKYLTKLKILYLHRNNISDIESLKNLDLDTLAISHNNISDISILYNMDNLIELSLIENKLPKHYNKYKDNTGWSRYKDLESIKNIIRIERRKRIINLLDK